MRTMMLDQLWVFAHLPNRSKIPIAAETSGPELANEILLGRIGIRALAQLFDGLPFPLGVLGYSRAAEQVAGCFFTSYLC